MPRQITSILITTALVIAGGCQPAANSNPGWTPATSSVPVSPPGTQPNPAGPPMNPADQASEQMIRKLADYYKLLNGVTCEVETTVAAGAGLAVPMASILTLEKPDRMAFRPADNNGIELVSNAQESATAVGALKKYVQGPTIGTFADLAMNPASLQIAGMGSMFAASLMSPDPYQAIMIGVTKTTLVGVEKVNDVSANHIRFEQPDMNWSMWFATEGDPVVLKTSFEMQLSVPGLAQQNVTHTSLYRNWKSNPKTTDETFAFKAPEGFEKADDLAGIFNGGVPGQAELGVMGKILAGLFGGGGGATPETKSPLLGKPAPSVVSQTLDGKPFDLSEAYASNIVMLDFWATWCPPCVAELPVLMKLADEYKEKGVVLYAVNSGEDVPTIKGFLAEQKWTLNVVLDEQDRFAQPYGVTGIPQLVLIDRQGVVQQVHVGYAPGIEKTLRNELDKMLAGPSAGSEKK